jgi:hypothetical protein
MHDFAKINVVFTVVLREKPVLYRPIEKEKV